MAEFTQLMVNQTIAKNEGEKFTNYPNDKPTKYGVVPDDIEECVKDGFLPSSVLENVVEFIKNLSLVSSAEIHKHQYFDKLYLSKLIYQEVAAKIFDMALPLGRYWAIVCAQRACIGVAGGELEEDGIMGKDTVNAINQCYHTPFLASYRSECAGRFRNIAKVNPAKAEFLSGWIARAYQR